MSRCRIQLEGSPGDGRPQLSHGKGQTLPKASSFLFAHPHQRTFFREQLVQEQWFSASGRVAIYSLVSLAMARK